MRKNRLRISVLAVTLSAAFAVGMTVPAFGNRAYSVEAATQEGYKEYQEDFAKYAKKGLKVAFDGTLDGLSVAFPQFMPFATVIKGLGGILFDLGNGTTNPNAEVIKRIDQLEAEIVQFNQEFEEVLKDYPAEIASYTKGLGSISFLPDGYDGVRESFIGPYRTERNPLGVEAGKLTVGGAVKVVVAGADLTDPVVPPERIAELQEKIDPRSSAAEGDSIAPIGHLVTVASVEKVQVNITVAVTFHNNNTTAEDVQTAVEGVVSKYFVDLCKKWSASGKNGVDILHSTISFLILADELLASWIRTVESVTISGTDGANKNRTLGVDEVPVLGEVTIV